jgi:hypothetical protein
VSATPAATISLFVDEHNEPANYMRRMFSIHAGAGSDVISDSEPLKTSTYSPNALRRGQLRIGRSPAGGYLYSAVAAGMNGRAR